MARRPQGRIVRRTDVNGRVYYVDRQTGKQRSGKAWRLDVEARQHAEPRRAPKPRGYGMPEFGVGGGGGGGGGGGLRGGPPEPYPRLSEGPAFPSDVGELGEPDWDDFDWEGYAVGDESIYEEG